MQISTVSRLSQIQELNQPLARQLCGMCFPVLHAPAQQRLLLGDHPEEACRLAHQFIFDMSVSFLNQSA